ncbi:MAG TPA: efflux transporter periplasmic adaptor subunit [Verrucomicrobiales bacterium]|nr:efflux transporter periplasmic adaptor subunit [Verrucomicrobiales bacterium]
MKNLLRIILPVVVLALGAGIAFLMIRSRPPVQPREPVVIAPLVRVQMIQPTNVSLTVQSQGTVRPRTEISLVSEVTGVITRAADALAEGGFFEKGELLLEIDPRDYELAVVQAEARVREAEARLLREEAEAAIAREEWTDLGRQGQPSALLLREPQLAEARAMVDSARANVELARRDLEKTRTRAPFAGRVLEKLVDVGQYVNRGGQLARIYSTDAAEIRLPITAEEAGFVELPVSYRGEGQPDHQPPVRVRASVGRREHVWNGRIVRTEGEIDVRTRMITVVAEVLDPYDRRGGSATHPLSAGLFVNAEISGRRVEGIYRLPRIAVRGVDTVLVIDPDNRLRIRKIGMLRSERAEVLVESGLSPGDRICLTPLEAPVDGMEVRIAEEVEAGRRIARQGGAQ